MKGGFNKIIRNIVAGASDTEFEKVRFLTISLFAPDSQLHAGHRFIIIFFHQLFNTTD